jgi:class 3 adenylate cyclase/predicted ATPase
MKCSGCGHENRQGRKFCAGCGAPLAVACPACRTANEADEKFCGECGAPLGEQGAPQPAAPPGLAPAAPGPAEAAERRQLTVMFCDLVGSTALSAQLDPEELRAVVRAYQQTSAAVIERYDGHIAQYLGDGLLVYFGYPVAHEDDAARAVRAGLEIVAALRHRAVEATPVAPLQIRIGIHTGPVVVGEMGGGSRHEQLALGETPNIAARLQGLAEPDSVVVSAATQRLVAGLFNCQDLGPQTLKGISIPISAYLVSGESAAQSRFDAAIHEGLTPLVGRGEELALLRQRWEQAKAGAGQVVLLSGEPGIGKSRLMQELKEQLAHEGATRIEFRCSPYHQNSAFYPILTHLQRLLEFAPQDTPQAKLDTLAQRLTRYRFLQADTLPLLAALLSLPHPEGVPPLTLSPQKQKQKTQEALVAWIVEEAEKAPVYCAWQDLHWADPSTLEFLTLYLEQIPTIRAFTVLTFRPDFTPPWGARSYLSQLTLSRLGRPQVETLIDKVTGGKTLPLEVIQQIVAKTDGVPLFVEELTKMVLESGLLGEAEDHYELTGPLPLLAIPSTLQDSLMARLDRLVPERELAQLGATLGREFSYELIHAVSPLDEGSLQHGLRRLVETELVYQRGVPPQAHYLFKHALIQDTAYQSLLKSTRQQYHQQIAQVLEERFSETVKTQPELVAQHYSEAGLIAQALPYWQKAGRRAVERSAYAEATSHLLRGLELLKTLPDSSERARQELKLQIALGDALSITKGFGASEVKQPFTRARELCRQVGETPQLFRALGGLWVFYENRTEYKTALEFAEQYLRLAQSTQDPYLLVWAHHLVGETLYFLGEWASVRAHLEQGIALYDPYRHRSLALPVGNDPGTMSRSFLAYTLWFLGYPDQALTRSHEALTLAKEFAHPVNLATALNCAAMLHLFRREGQAAQEQAERLMAVATEQGFTLRLAQGTSLRGRALAMQGQVEEGIVEMRQGRAASQATGSELGRTSSLAVLAEAYGKVGQTEEGLSMLAEALTAVGKTGEHYYEAELYRIKGQLTRAEAEACFLKAIEIAQKQQAKSLELRATMSLSRLWQQQGKKKEAHQMLAEIYGWFSEGFDTADLKDAKALLEELS